MTSTMCITLGGSGGSGKTTLARAIAARVRTTGVHVVTLQTGTMYRSLAKHLAISNVPLGDEEACARHLAVTHLTIGEDGELRINGDSVATDGREAEGARAAQIARHPTLRAGLICLLKTFIASSASRGEAIVIDARDGPEIWPLGRHFWLETPRELRALRRAAQTGQPLRGVIEQLQERDEADRGLGRLDGQVASSRTDIYVLDGRKSVAMLVEEVLSQM